VESRESTIQLGTDPKKLYTVERGSIVVVQRSSASSDAHGYDAAIWPGKVYDYKALVYRRKKRLWFRLMPFMARVFRKARTTKLETHPTLVPINEEQRTKLQNGAWDIP